MITIPIVKLTTCMQRINFSYVIFTTTVRYKTMKGFYCPYIPGWDTHGLPIENAIQKLGVNRKELSTADFRKKCYEYALQQVEKQKEQCIRIGTFADYDHPYLTLNKEQLKLYEECNKLKNDYHNGWIEQCFLYGICTYD